MQLRSLLPLLPAGVPALLSSILLATGASAQQLQVTEVASGFSSPLYLCSPPGDMDRLFIVEQRGVIKIIKNGTVLGTPFLDIDSLTNGGGERGLLGLAFHPDYAQNGRFFVSYTDTSNRSVVREYLVSADPDVADPAAFRDIFGPLAQPFPNHNGGCIQFGADDKLYLGLGDGGSGNDPGNRAQNPLNLLGKMLRFDVDIPSPFIPPDNPFVGDPNTSDEIWSLGLRNPWRFSFDRMTGDMWIGDVGQGSLEEIDFEAAGQGGLNYGWRCMEGTSCTGLSGCTCNGIELTLPVHEYSHAVGCSITGGYRYRGTGIPGFDGRYFFGDYCTARVWSFAFDGAAISDLQNHTADLAIPGTVSLTSFGEDAAGELYIVDANGGQIWRIERECFSTPTNFCTTAPNSFGPGAIMAWSGTPSISADDFHLFAAGCPPNKFCLFYYGDGQSAGLPFGNGWRCVTDAGGGLYRFPVLKIDALGVASMKVDFDAPPAGGGGAGTWNPGDVWNCQAWFRDPPAGGANFNLSDGLEVHVCP